MGHSTLNQKIIAALSIIALVLSTVNLTVYVSFKNTNSAGVNPSAPASNLYVVNVTCYSYMGNYTMWNGTIGQQPYSATLIYVKNPSASQTLFYLVWRDLASGTVVSYAPQPVWISPRQTVTVSAATTGSQIQVCIYDYFQGFVYDAVVNVQNVTDLPP
jgi:hypothetical protein